jgi:hypothetical protein
LRQGMTTETKGGCTASCAAAATGACILSVVLMPAERPA